MPLKLSSRHGQKGFYLQSIVSRHISGISHIAVIILALMHVVLTQLQLVSSQVPTPQVEAQSQSSSELEASPLWRQPLDLRGRDVPASHEVPAFSRLLGDPPGGMLSRPRAPSPELGTGPVFAIGEPANIPLHKQIPLHSLYSHHVLSAIRMVLACIDICVVMLTMYITSTEACVAHIAQRKKRKKRVLYDMGVTAMLDSRRYDVEDDASREPHVKQLLDLIAWHIGVMESTWYVKPRSTCWFEEYLFKIYTPDMFYDILRMRRQTFDKLVHDLRPFIQGQAMHWRQPIGVEKKLVVTLFKLMHGVCIPLVADRAALGKSTVHEILRQVCSAISTHFGYLIAWPTGRRLVRTRRASSPSSSSPTVSEQLTGPISMCKHPQTALWRRTTGTVTNRFLYCYRVSLTVNAISLASTPVRLDHCTTALTLKAPNYT